jgi:hypothetical protein
MGAGAGAVGGERVDGVEVDGGSGRDKGKGKARAGECSGLLVVN